LNILSFVQLASIVTDYEVKGLEILNPFSMPMIEFVLPLNVFKGLMIRM